MQGHAEPEHGTVAIGKRGVVRSVIKTVDVKSGHCVYTDAQKSTHYTQFALTHFRFFFVRGKVQIGRFGSDVIIIKYYKIKKRDSI